MARGPEGIRIAILATDGVERVELEQPTGALYGAGATSDLLSIHPGEIQARQFDIVAAGTFSVDRRSPTWTSTSTTRCSCGVDGRADRARGRGSGCALSRVSR